MTPDAGIQADQSAPTATPLLGKSNKDADAAFFTSPAAVAAPAGLPPVLLHLPNNSRSLSMVMLAAFAALFVLHWAKAVFIPLMLGLIFSYALSPIVNWLESKHVPRSIGAAVLLLSIFSAMGSAAYSLSDEAVKLVDSLPAAAQKFRQAIKNRQTRSDSTLETVQKAAAQIEQAAQEGAAPTNNRGAIRVVVESSRFNVKDYLWTGTI
ncbi:MAG: AI-2E family transporter, partial [Pseudomonadota bacterium]